MTRKFKNRKTNEKDITIWNAVAKMNGIPTPHGTPEMEMPKNKNKSQEQKGER